MAASLPPLVSEAIGNANGPTLVFVHGWPDDMSLWDKMVARLQGDYYCVRVTLPNFGASTVSPKGFSFEAITQALTQLVIDTQKSRNRAGEVRVRSDLMNIVKETNCCSFLCLKSLIRSFFPRSSLYLSFFMIGAACMAT